MPNQKQDNFLQIRLEGDAVGSGRISVSHLLRLLSQFDKALHRSGRVVLGEADSIRRGPQPNSIKEELALDLTLLTHGSPTTVLGFERRQPQPSLPGMDMDLGVEILEKAIKGLTQVQQSGTPMPAGYDAGVLMAWRDAGALFNQGVDEITFTLNHRQTPIVARYTKEGHGQLQERILGPQINIRTIEGRLLMADFKESGTRCRVHPSVGNPVLCLFDEDQKEEVLEDILRYVKIVGEAKEDPTTGKITSIKIHDIERLENREDEAADLLPQGTPISRDFWESPTLDELAESQNFKPMVDVRALFGTWPGEENDGFEEAIDELRHPSTAGGGRL